MKTVYGATTGLKPSQQRALERIYRRKVPPELAFTSDLAVTCCRISWEIGRQIGVLIDRRGRIEYVIAGDQSEVVIPSLGRIKTGAGKLKGLRLVHTHLKNEPLSKDDLTDLAMLRLDLVTALGVGKDGQPATVYTAHLNPSLAAPNPWKLLDPAPFQTFDFNFGEFIGGLETEISRHDSRREEKGTLKAVLVHISNLPGIEAEERLDELSELARTEMIVAVDRAVFRGSPNPRNLLGSGRVKDVVVRSMSLEADMILFDQEITPAQARWIGAMTEMPILDRTQLILRIFARRAFSADGKLKVELARLSYALPRIGTKDDALSRIRGGIGLRGPGETSMEIARRRIKDRISAIHGKLKKLGLGREQRRSLRKRSGARQVAVIGYTNAGKSTLLNALTKSSVLVEDKLFATLDPASRRIRFPKNMEVIFSDTVGFIRDLPDGLLDAFRSTLEELNDADLLLHLVDVSAHDFEAAIRTVEEILGRIGLAKIPRRLVFNKVDLIDPAMAENLARRYGALLISAAARTGLDALTLEIASELDRIAVEKTRQAVFEE